MNSFQKRLIFSLLILWSAVNATKNPGKRPSFSADADNLKIELSSDGTYRINVRGQTWLFGAPTFFNVDGQVYTQNDNLKLVSQGTRNGTDSFGRFELITFQYRAGVSEIKTSIKTYASQPFVYFSQEYVNGANNTRAENVNDTISGFPSFNLVKVVTQQGPLGYLSYGGQQGANNGKTLGMVSPDLNITYGLEGGPITIFDGSGDAIVISPASNFMAASHWHQKTEGAKRLVYGIMGGIERVPAGTVMDFIVYYSSQGVNKAMEGWGDYLRNKYGRTDEYVRNDMTINYLGYYTDDGAYYYYHRETGKTYQDTIIDIAKYADQIKIPYRYIQYDSWWYIKDDNQAVVTWEPRPDFFPKGLEFVYKKTGLKSVAHNRYWSNQTTYARQNGGQYDFIVETGGLAVPVDQRFWDDLLANASKWGLYTYEQDWLNVELAGMEALLSNISLGATWINQIGAAAKKYKMTIQYGMACGRHMLQALQNPVITQARVSRDNRPPRDQWKIGISSLLSYALGLAPSKDNFWSVSDQPGNPYPDGREPYPTMQVIVSVLSTGPVAPGDGINYTDKALVMRCCNAKGLILKPSKPATAIDDQIYREALPDQFISPDGEVYSTYSEISGLVFGIIFAADLNGQYSITPSKAGFLWKNLTFLMVYDSRNPGELSTFSEQEPLLLSGCSQSQPCVYHTTSMLSRGPDVYLLGELDKIVPVSPQRITEINLSLGVVEVILTGKPSEMVNISFSLDGNLVTRTAQLDPLGDGSVRLMF